MLSAAVSIASFSVVLAETFAAVGLSSLIPAGFITLARGTKQILGGAARPDLDPDDITDISDAIAYSATPKPEAGGTSATSVAPAEVANKLLKALAKSVDDLDVLLPKTAKIHGEFEFHGSEKYAYGAEAGCAVEMVTVKAGYSAMYEASSSNKVTLDVEFVSVHVEI
jgi:hypothetical protein